MKDRNELLSQIIDNLTLIKNNKADFSQIDKDIILQNLREAYMLLLQEPTMDSTQSIENKSDNVTTKVETTIVKPAIEKVPEPVKPAPVTPEVKPETKPVVEKPAEPVVEKVPEPVKPAPVAPEVKPETKPVVEKPAESVVEKVPEAVKPMAQTPDIPKKEVTPVEEHKKPVEKTQEEELDEMDNDILQFISSPAKTESAPKNTTPTPNPKVETTSHDSLFPNEQTSRPAPEPKPQRSLNDLFNEQKKENSISDKFQQTKVVDLTKAMSINDKFLFIRELFKNKSEEFSRAIQTLNNCTNIEEAFDIMEGLKKQYFWDSTSSAYLALCDLVRRKF